MGGGRLVIDIYLPILPVAYKSNPFTIDRIIKELRLKAFKYLVSLETNNCQPDHGLKYETKGYDIFHGTPPPFILLNQFPSLSSEQAREPSPCLLFLHEAV